MNRLILIGNGFDLAHGMKTSYNDFILWYLKKCFSEADTENTYEDDLIQITKRHNSWPHYIKNTSELVDHFHRQNLTGLFYDDKVTVEHNQMQTTFSNPFQGKINSFFAKLIFIKCTNFNWVDIENEFYIKLKDVFNMPTKFAGDGDNTYRMNDLNALNSSLEILIQELEKYLLSLGSSPSVDSYKEIFKANINKDDVVINNDLKEDEDPKVTLVLNFNYTSTPKKYFKTNQLNYNINYIHGKINDQNNRLIFGFGDELDEDYKKLELQKSNEFFEHIKSFWYFKTSNYHNLVRFIEGEEFQVYILGHSCGLSDRTMLNMIFEHENCKSIKIFYHGTKEKNNYTNLTQEISRHFKDKGMMRKKIVPFDKSEPMPQVE